LGVVIILIGAWRGGRSIRIGNSSGNIIGGDAKGVVTMNYTNQAAEPHRSAPPTGDRVVWVLTAIGILIAIAGIVLAHMDAGH
jgi:hypothetical protein